MTPAELHADAGALMAASLDDGTACPAFGTVMPPALSDQARRWQRRCRDHGFAGIDRAVEQGGRGLRHGV